MKNLTCLRVTAALLTLFSICMESRAQQEDVPKLEIGGQFSSLSLSPPGAKREVGAGVRVTYNFNEHIAAEAEGNFFPSGSTRGGVPGGSITQAQFGIKAGRRWEKFGLFAKARPGFVSFGETFAPRRVGETTIGGRPFPIYDFDATTRTTHFSADIGGVVEVYPSKRIFARFDAGDTIIRHGSLTIDFPFAPLVFPAQVTHNFQFSAGIGFRLLSPRRDDDSIDVTRSRRRDEGSPGRVEAGAQITSLTFNPPRQLPTGLPFFTSENRPVTETGLGGRLGFNLNNSVGVESEINYFPTSDGFIGYQVQGRVLQGQFGVKVGKRFDRFGFFGKVRPGFVRFSRVNRVANHQRIDEPKFYFSTDVGGVFELYPSRRIFIRFDAGDTIIRYGTRNTFVVIFGLPVITAPPETRHNFQFSSGFGVRF